MKETIASYIDRWISKAASGGLRNPLLKMPVKRFRALKPTDVDVLAQGRRLIIGTSSDPIARNLYKNYDEKIRERGEHTGFLTLGSIEVILAGASATGAKRTALMPVWLQRIDIRKQSENIVAQPTDEPMWDLNPELPAILQPLGIDTKQGPRDGPSQLLQWLSAQIGNRGRVDTQTSYIGCFSSQHLVIRERLSDGRWRRAFAQNEAVIAKVLGGGDGPVESTAQAIRDTAIEDLGLALPIDDSQLKVVQLADSGCSMVVQGPPGTGKSQTIVNLITNALWRGKRVLVVCDKRTAIRQVEERLVKCDLGPALLNLHDEGLDKKAFLQQAIDAFPIGASTLTHYPVEALAELRNELNQRVIDGQTVVHPALGISRHSALAGLIKLRDKLRNAPSINIANWQSLSSERLNRLIGCLTEWETLGAVAANADPIWNGVDWSVFREDPNARVELLTVLEDLNTLLGRLIELREMAAIVGFNDDFVDLSAVRQLSNLAKSVAKRPKCHATILDDATLSLSHIDLLEAAQVERVALLAKGHPVDLRVGPSPTSRGDAEKLVSLESVATWDQLIERNAVHRGTLTELIRINLEYSRIATQRGWVVQKRQSERVAQMSQFQDLLDTQVAIPPKWWSQVEGSPAAELNRWKREIESLEAHAKKAPLPLDLAALDRVADTTWPDFQAIAEDGFNAVSYVLRYRKDSRVKLALKQVYPQLSTSGKTPFLDLVLHAIKTREILVKVKAAATWHFDLSGLTEACFAQSATDGFLTGEYRARFESIQRAAALTERLRLRNDLFMLDNPVWSAQWETTGMRQVGELQNCLQAWTVWRSPLTTDDNVEHNRNWLEERIELIAKFLKTHLNAQGNQGLRVIDAWVDASAYAEKTKKLEELILYKEITEASSDSVDWASLRAVIQWRDEFRALRGTRRLDLDHATWRPLTSKVTELLVGFEKGLNTLGRFFLGSVEEGQVFTALATRLQIIASGMTLLDVWCRKVEWGEKVSAWPELQPFWARITDGSTVVEQARPLFCYNLLRLSTPHITPNGLELSAKLKTFATQDEQLERWSISELRDRLAKQQQDAQARHRLAFAEIRRLAGLSRISGTVRQLCQANLPLLLDLKQAWLMSPTSLANLMDLQRLDEVGQPFDLVIFDEASQIPVTEGLLPLGFAKQTIIVGDDKQLPPTTYFSTTTQADEEDAEELGESESLIDEFNGSLTPSMLMAHYRSETPDLISFSNREFYDSKLEMYPPSRVTGLGRRYHLVSNGVFDSGRSRTNRPEAQAVVRLVEEHVKQYSECSLGVVAMNAEQMDLIESLLVSTSPNTRAFCADDERFFIRNLETVQGDEMDRIIVSLTYGKNTEGRFNAAILGPLVRKGGHRRLNVALSRSRTGMTLVSSMTAADLAQSDAQSQGFACLKRLLEELEITDAQSTFGIAHKRFEKRQDGGVSQIVYCESPFEEEVVEFLENRGYELRCQYGVQRPDGLGSFRIDIVVMENGTPLIAVECDGAAYHRSLSARTRDRARQTQLERLGWRFHRVWSTNWWLFVESEKTALLAAIETARRQHIPARHGPALGAIHTVASTRDESQRPSPTASSPVSSPRITTAPVVTKKDRRDSTHEGLGELFSGEPVIVEKAAPKPSQPTKPAPSAEQLPTLLQDWSRRPGWPEAAVGKRVQWAGAWGLVTKVEREGKSVFFRDEVTGQHQELSAEFIRMRSGSTG
jgi:very-short-patch-repair endonuclease